MYCWKHSVNGHSWGNFQSVNSTKIVEHVGRAVKTLISDGHKNVKNYFVSIRRNIAIFCISAFVLGVLLMILLDVNCAKTSHVGINQHGHNKEQKWR